MEVVELLVGLTMAYFTIRTTDGAPVDSKSRNSRKIVFKNTLRFEGDNVKWIIQYTLLRLALKLDVTDDFLRMLIDVYQTHRTNSLQCYLH